MNVEGLASIRNYEGVASTPNDEGLASTLNDDKCPPATCGDNISPAASNDRLNGLASASSDGERSSRVNDDGNRIEGLSECPDTATASWKAIDPPLGYPSINHRPVLLKTSVLCAAGSFFFLAMMGLGVLAWTSDRSTPYKVRNVNYYIVLRYGPALLGAVSQTVFQLIVRQFLRMLPFVNMASPRRPKRAQDTISAGWWPFLFVRLNDLDKLVLQAMMMLNTYLIGAKVFLVEIVDHMGSWTIFIHPTFAWYLTSYYGSTLAVTIWITVLLVRNRTSIRSDWEPECLADYLALFNTFNVKLNHCKMGGFVFPDLDAVIDKHCYRLGYWKRTEGAVERIAYGIRGSRSEPLPKPTTHATTEPTRVIQPTSAIRPSSSTRPNGASTSGLLQRSRERHIAMAAKAHPYYPYLFRPYWLLHHWMILISLPALIALLLLVATTGYLAHGFAIDKHYSLHRLDRATAEGIHLAPVLSNLTMANNATFIPFGPGVDSRANRILLVDFLIRFLPIAIFLFALNDLANMDLAYRIYRPVHNLTSQACSATDSLLMDYFTRSPFAVSAHALSKEYLKVFTLSVVGSAGPALGIVPFGLLTLASTENGVIIGRFSTGAFVSTLLLGFVILGCYLMVFPYLPTRHHEWIPRPWQSPIDIWQAFCASELARLPEFGRCEDTWTKDHLRAALISRDLKYRLGVATDVDGNCRVGVDISCDSQNVPTNLVEGVQPRHPRTAHLLQRIFRGKWAEKERDAEEIPLAVRHRRVISATPNED